MRDCVVLLQDVYRSSFHAQTVLAEQGHRLGQDDPFRLLHDPALEGLRGVALLHGLL